MLVRWISPTGIALVSALAAGMHEVAWSRFLARPVGNTTVGLGITLSAFMAGGGVGALLAPRLRPLWHRPWRGYAAAEIVIALGSIGLVGYCTSGGVAADWLDAQGAAALTADIALTTAAALLPAFAMGTTYPFLVQAVRSHRHAASVLYAAGLVGTTIGITIAALAIAPLGGYAWIVAAAATTNVALALLAWRLDRPAPTVEATPDMPAHSGRARNYALLRFASAGALGLGAQVVWNRCLPAYSGVSTFSFAFITCTYVAAQGVAFLCSLRWQSLQRHADAALASAPSAIVLMLGVLGLAPELPARDAEPIAWFAGVAAITIGVIALPSALLGIAQADAVRAIDDDERRATNSARTIGWGTLASSCGAIVTSTTLLPAIGIRGSIAALATPIVIALTIERRIRAALATAAAVAVCVYVAAGPAHFLGPTFDRTEIVYAETGVQDNTAVVVVDLPLEPRIRRLVANGVSYSGDSIFAQRYMRLLGHLPALVTRGRRAALVICVGTGTTLDAVRAHGFERIDAVDISPSIRRTLPYFEHVNGDVLHDPRVRWIVDDGARYVLRSDEQYDLVTLEPPPPRAPGASSLYAAEFYSSVRDRLAPGGAVAQWLPLHGISGTEAEAIVHTFVTAFSNASLHLVERNEAILLGRTVDADRDRTGALALPPAEDLSSIGVPRGVSPEIDTALVRGGALRIFVGSARMIELSHPLPELAPLGRASSARSPLSNWVERLVAASDPAPGSFAEAMSLAAPAFVRMNEGRGRSGDAATVQRALEALLTRRPFDPYLQHIFGFGPLLEERLQRLATEIPHARRAALLRQMRRLQAAHARRRETPPAIEDVHPRPARTGD